jgi:hypothetical protein
MIQAAKDKDIAALRRLVDNGVNPDSETDKVSKILQHSCNYIGNSMPISLFVESLPHLAVPFFL